jgi:hypothetical protein
MSIRLSFVILGLCSATARASDWYVDQAYPNCAQSTGSAAQPFCTINGALQVAGIADTIHIAPGTYFESIHVQEYLQFVGTQGAAATIIDGGGRSRIMELDTGAMVRVSGITFHAGKGAFPRYAGALEAADATLELADCVFDSCAKGIEVTRGRMTIDRCVFRGNTSSLAPGAALYAIDVDLEIRDSLFEKNVGNCGAVDVSTMDDSDPIRIERCVFRLNYSAANGGGGLRARCAALTDCIFDGNVAGDPSNGFSATGGGAGIGGPSTLTRCRFVGNVAESKTTRSSGGGLAIGGDVTLVDCEIVGNSCSSVKSGEGGIGGGVVVTANATFVRCTIAGNRADGTGTVTSWGIGGGLCLYPKSNASITLDSTVISDNFAANVNGGQDFFGTATTNGWNLLGDSGGATLTGAGTNDLLDVDPLLVDPAHGDVSLTIGSPCIDSGDPAAAPGGLDLAGNPRLLDGDLDRVEVIDRGAHEFDHVRLAITGSATAGGTIQVVSTGTTGMTLLLVAGVGQAELAVPPYGSLFVDVAAPFVLIPWGTNPNTQLVTIPPTLPVPTTVMLQELGFSIFGGNLSNFVPLEIQ